MYSVFLSSYTNTRESLGELEKYINLVTVSVTVACYTSSDLSYIGKKTS